MAKYFITWKVIEREIQRGCIYNLQTMLAKSELLSFLRVASDWDEALSCVTGGIKGPTRWLLVSSNSSRWR